jgi:hypothetical protein
LTIPNVTGTVLQSGTAVTVAQGGTGLATLTANNVLLGNGTSALQVVAPGTSGNALVSNGTTWTSAAAPSPAALSTASGSAPSYSARSWVNFDGSTGTIRGNGNVSSITLNSSTNYSVNFTTAMSDANYSVCVAANNIVQTNAQAYAVTRIYSFATGSFVIDTPSAASAALLVCAAVFR